jgi:hypothetical protein
MSIRDEERSEMAVRSTQDVFEDHLRFRKQRNPEADIERT